MPAMNRRLTRGLWLIGVAAVLVNGWFLLTYYGPFRSGPEFAMRPEMFLILLVPVLGFVLSLFGLWRMWVAMRGPR
jgi:hypothetical protein